MHCQPNSWKFSRSCWGPNKPTLRTRSGVTLPSSRNSTQRISWRLSGPTSMHTSGALIPGLPSCRPTIRIGPWWDTGRTSDPATISALISSQSQVAYEWTFNPRKFLVGGTCRTKFHHSSQLHLEADSYERCSFFNAAPTWAASWTRATACFFATADSKDASLTVWARQYGYHVWRRLYDWGRLIRTRVAAP